MSGLLEKNRIYYDRREGLSYCRAIKDFLSVYKTKKCTKLDQHFQQICPDYHSNLDKRRNPYSDHTFKYYPIQKCLCEDENCPNYHYDFEYYFHPLIYKTKKCPHFQQCQGGLECPYLHHLQERNFNEGQFFRFDINSFKTKPCPWKEPHERKVCMYYHNHNDRRRSNFDQYSHILCFRQKCRCDKAHNKIEQLYHPSRYKSKYCQTFNKNTEQCEYRDFCSFAHSEEEIAIELLDPSNKDPNYIINNYKTVWCPYTIDHDRSQCPYAHNIQDYRRKPKNYKYLPEKCQYWYFSDKIESIEQAGCKAGMNCNKCHGWMQLRYHPQNYNKKGKWYPKKEEMLEKKLNHKDVSRKSREKPIESIANRQIQMKKPHKHGVGAPFFKSERQPSEASKKTKAKTINLGSDKSCNSEINKQQKMKQITPIHISTLYFEDEDHRVWNFTEDGREHKQKEYKEQSRAKSQGKSEDYEPSYTQSITELFNQDTGILGKLKEYKVNEVSLVTMKECKLNRISFFDQEERKKLVCKLREYNLKKDSSIVDYSPQLTRFFVRSKAVDILNKLRKRKIKEDKVLKIQSRQTTKDFSFLDEEEKERLPKLLRTFKEEKEFGSLMQSVTEFVEEHPPDK